MDARHTPAARCLSRLFAALILLFVSAELEASTILYDAGAGLMANPGVNPNGTWTYGGFNSALTTFTPFGGANGGASYTGVDSASTGASFFEGWGYNTVAAGLVPTIAVNTNAGSIEQPIPGITAVAIGELWVHPGPGPAPGPGDRDPQDQVDVRWTSPGTGTVVVQTTWTQLSTNPSQGLVLINGVSVFNQAATTSAIFYNASMSVAAGTTFDFITARNPTVGDTSNSTQLTADVQFTPVPEPAAWGLLALAGALCAGRRAQKRWSRWLNG